MSDTNVSLVADIGGTHARFAVVLPDGSIAHAAVLTDPALDSCAAVCRHYLDMLPKTCRMTRAAWAVAGPVTGDHVTITNRGWRFSRHEVQRLFGWEQFTVVNDFAALALSLPHLGDADTHLIKAGHADAAAPLCVIGPGTGLGVAGLVPLGTGRWHLLPGEGGHVALPPVDERENRILCRLQQRFGAVAAEHVLSGRGLVHLAAAMHDGETALWDRPEDIVAAAQADDPRAVVVVLQFCAFLGTVASDAALTLGARGGVYLAGGILPKMVPLLLRSAFAARFVAKDAVGEYLHAVPVRLITHPLPAFLGLRGVVHGPA